MEEKSGHVSAVLKAFNLLDCFLEGNEPLSLKEITQRTGLPKSTVHGLLSDMKMQQIIVQNEPGGKYCMGLHIFELGIAFNKSHDIIQIAKPYMKHLANSIDKPVHLNALRGNHLVLIGRSDPMKGPLAVKLAIGAPLLLYCTASGKLCLAHMPERAIAQYLRETELVPYTPKTITDPDILKKELKKIRAQGFALDEGEMNVGVHGIAAPIFNLEGKIVYALGTAGIVNFFQESRQQYEVNLVLKATSEISSHLGYKN